MKLLTFLFACCFLCSCGSAHKWQKPRKLKNKADSIGYIIGMARALSGSSERIPLSGFSKRMERKGYSDTKKAHHQPAFDLYDFQYLLNKCIEDESQLATYQADAAHFINTYAEAPGVFADFDMYFTVDNSYVLSYETATNDRDTIYITHSVENIKGEKIESERMKTTNRIGLIGIFSLYDYDGDTYNRDRFFNACGNPRPFSSYVVYKPYCLPGSKKPYMILVHKVDVVHIKKYQ